MKLLNWSEFKALLLLKSASLQYTESSGFYYLEFFDGPLHYTCRMDKNPSDTTDLLDFTTNYKDTSNNAISSIQSDERKQIVLMSMTNSDWHYEPRALDFYTAKYNSLYNRDCSGNGIDGGTDYADGWIVFKDASGNIFDRNNYQSDEDYQTDLTQSCVQTEMYFEPAHDFEIFGAILNIKSRPLGRAYLWVTAVPDIPSEYGGCIPFMGGGLNLSFLPDAAVIKYDAKTGSRLNYNFDYHTNKLAMIVKHSAGEEIGIQIVYEFYKA